MRVQPPRISPESIGELFALPRDELATRFGADLLLRLDQAIGSALETIEPIRPGRSYPRKKRVKRKRFPMCYKPVR